MYWDFGPSVECFGLRTTIGLRLILSQQTAVRLANTCFRGPRVVRSGNFLFWHSFKDVLADEEFGRVLLKVIEAKICLATLGGRQKFQDRLSFDFSYPVGWTSAMEGDEAEAVLYDVPEAFESFFVNRRTQACRIRRGWQSYLPAPLTHKVTMNISCDIVPGQDYWVVEVHTIYPGADIGRLQPSDGSGWMRGLFFWDFSAPGSTRIRLFQVERAPVSI